MKVALSDRLSPTEMARVRAFCDACASVSYLQDPDWPALWSDTSGRHSYHHVVVTGQDGEVAGYGALRRSRLAGGYALGAFRRGPVTRSPEDLAPVCSAMLQHLKALGFVSVAVNPRWEDERAATAEDVLADLGAMPAPTGRQRLHSRTGLIDLSHPPDDVFATCSAHARRQFRKIDRLDLSVRPLTTDAEGTLFATWFAEFCKDRGLDRKGLPSIAAQRLWVDRKGGDCAMIDCGGQPVGAFTLFRDGPRIFNLALAWANPNARIPRSYIVYWYAIRQYAGQAGNGGPRWLDTAGLADPRVARSDAGEEGRDRFKSGFPMRPVMLTRVHRFELRPLIVSGFDRLEAWLR